MERKVTEWGLTEVKVGTVDAYQGSTEDIVIILTTRDSPGSSEFITDFRRLNV